MRWKEEKEEVPEPPQQQVQQTHREDLLPERANSCTAKVDMSKSRSQGQRRAEEEGQRRGDRRRPSKTQMKEEDQR